MKCHGKTNRSESDHVPIPPSDFRTFQDLVDVGGRGRGGGGEHKKRTSPTKNANIWQKQKNKTKYIDKSASTGGDVAFYTTVIVQLRHAEARARTHTRALPDT